MNLDPTKQDSSYKFEARVWFIGSYATVETWSSDFHSMKSWRGVEDWVREHLQECYTTEQLRELFTVPEEGNFQAMCTGTIHGYWSPDTPNGPAEYDEDVTMLSIAVVPIPDSYIELVKDTGITGA